jgi:hypothetical protein
MDQIQLTKCFLLEVRMQCNEQNFWLHISNDIYQYHDQITTLATMENTEALCYVTTSLEIGDYITLNS